MVRTAAIVTLACAVLFGVLACPTIWFGDGPELIAAAASLGVAHPPGYPLYTLLGWLALHLPVGEPAYRMNLLSAAFAALACGATAWLVERIGGSRAGGLTAGLALGVSSTLLSVATVAEVYALHLFLLVAGLAAAAAVGGVADARTRGLAAVAGGVVLGAGLAHHPTIVLALPTALLLAVPWRPRGADTRDGGLVARFLPRVPVGYAAAAIVAAVLIPCVLYGTLILRARAHPAASWGSVTAWSALLAHVRAAGFRHLDLGWAGLGRADAWKGLGALVLHEYNPLVLPLAFLGLVGPLRSAPGPAARFGVVVLMAATALFGLRYATADVQVFYLPLFFGLAVAAGLAVAWLAHHGRREVRLLAPVLGGLLVALTAVGDLPSRNLRGATAAADHARDILAGAPRGSVLFLEAPDAFGVLYVTRVLRERPDLTIYDRTGTLFRDLLDDFHIPARRGESVRGYRIRTEQAFIDHELTTPLPRAVLFLEWPGYEAPPRYRVEPIGLLHRVRPASDPLEDPRPLWKRYHEAEVTRWAGKTADPLARAAAATYRVARGERAMFEGNRASAGRWFEEAGRLADGVAAISSYVGTVYGRYGDLDLAVSWLRRAVEIQPSYYRAWNNLAIAYERLGRVEDARSALRRSLDLVPTQPEVVESLRRLEGTRR